MTISFTRLFAGVALLTVIFSSLLMAMPVPAGAQGGTPDGQVPGGTPDGQVPDTSNCASGGAGCLENPLNNINSLQDLLIAILRAVVRIGSIILVLALVYVGFKFVAAQGNEEALRSARSALMWTVIGGLILLGAEAIALVIQATVEQL